MSEMECTCSRVESSSKLHKSGWRLWTEFAQRQAGLPKSPVTSAETNTDVSVDESGPLSVEEIGRACVDEDVVQEAEWKHGSFPAPVLPSMPKWRHTTSLAKTKEAEQIPTVSVDCGFFGQPEDRAHNTLPVLIVRDRKTMGIWSHPVPAKGVTHPYPAKARMTDLDPERLAWRDCAWSISKGREQEQRRGRSCSPVRARTCGNHTGISKPAWLVEHCSNLLVLFHKGEPNDGHRAYMRGQALETRDAEFWRVRRLPKRHSSQVGNEMVQRRVCGCSSENNRAHCVVDETGTHVVQSVRRVPEEQLYDHRLLQSVHRTTWEPNPGDASTDLLEPTLIIPQLPDVEPAPTKTYHSDNRGTRNVQFACKQEPVVEDMPSLDFHHAHWEGFKGG